MASEEQVLIEALRKSLPEIAILFQNALKIEVPVDTGRGRNSIKVIADGDEIEASMVHYLKIVNDGRNPSVIKPKTKKALFWKGAEHPVKRVNHPGIRPNPFIDRAVRKIPKIVAETLPKYMK